MLLPPLEISQAFAAPGDTHLTSVVVRRLEDALLLATREEPHLKKQTTQLQLILLHEKSQLLVRRCWGSFSVMGMRKLDELEGWYLEIQTQNLVDKRLAKLKESGAQKGLPF